MSPFILFLLLAAGFYPVYGALYCNRPLPNTPCQAGSPCLVSWLDDGQLPLLTSMGASTVGLYYGELQIVQQITPVDVSSVHALEFVPNPKAGPSSDQYYITFTSTVLKINGTFYQAFSSRFPINGMTGSFSSPIPSLTSPIPIPPTVASHPPNTVSGTLTIGTISLPTTSSTSPSTTSTPTQTRAPSSGFRLTPIPTTLKWLFTCSIPMNLLLSVLRG